MGGYLVFPISFTANRSGRPSAAKWALRKRRRSGSASSSFDTDPEGGLLSAMTLREKKVLSLVAEGYTNGEIAAGLGINPRTVETERAHLMRNLGLGTFAELIAYALRRGIISSDP